MFLKWNRLKTQYITWMVLYLLIGHLRWLLSWNIISHKNLELSWWWSYCSWISNYLCNQCLSPLKLWILNPVQARCTQYNIMWYSLSVTSDKSVVFSGRVLSTNKTNRHDITEILLKVVLDIITLNPSIRVCWKKCNIKFTRNLLYLVLFVGTQNVHW